MIEIIYRDHKQTMIRVSGNDILVPTPIFDGEMYEYDLDFRTVFALTRPITNVPFWIISTSRSSKSAFKKLVSSIKNRNREKYRQLSEIWFNIVYRTGLQPGYTMFYNIDRDEAMERFKDHLYNYRSNLPSATDRTHWNPLHDYLLGRVDDEVLANVMGDTRKETVHDRRLKREELIRETGAKPLITITPYQVA